MVLLYRLAEKGLLPVSWFRRVDPAAAGCATSLLGTGAVPVSWASGLARRSELGQHPCLVVAVEQA